ncbi:DUF748 domain-containing protein [Ideonella sp. 4Y11]|uniref:DUF748 domain-containing protein n=1 Tax=Ideonella aquatica TaxID=2824119 RepID=A0A940YNY4_9BURK|nr:DUF748 domain-containing protein [Ideonella aquatica]MBQ0961354.1 DUF748 domain-containing protein [Ideonella aquatica]
MSLNPPPTTPDRPERWQQPAVRRLARIAAGIAIVWLVLVVLALMLPSLLRGMVEREASQALGRAVRIERLSFNPLTLNAQVEGLAVAGEAADAPPLLQVDRVSANLSLASLWQRAPVLDALQIERPRLSLARLDANRYSIDDLLTRFAQPSEPGAAPLRVALYNLRVADGDITLDDRPAKRVHRLTAIELGLPVVSNLDEHDVAILVEPRLRLRLNGTEVDTGAQARPFAKERAGELRLDLNGLNLADWHAYWPEAVPVHLQAGRLHTALRLRFSAPVGAAPTVSLQGQLGISEAQLVSARGEPLLAWQQLNLSLADVKPLQRQVHLARLAWSGARWQLRREASGRLAGWMTAPTPGRAAAATAVPPSSSASSPASPASVGWTVQLDELQLTDHALSWQDATTQPAAQLAVQDIGLSVQQLRWPVGDATIQAEATMGLPTAAAPAASAAGQLRAQATLSAARSSIRLQASDLGLAAWRPYLAALLQARLDGRLSAEAQADWTGLPEGLPTALGLQRARLDDLRLTDGTQRPLAWTALELGPVQVDPARRAVRIDRVTWQSPQAVLSRDAAGRLSAQDWLVPQPAAASGESAPWTLALERLQVRGGQLQWQDAATGGDPVALLVDGVALQLGPLRWPAVAGAPTSVTGELRLAAANERPQRGAARAGQLRWDGRLALVPSLAWQGKVQAQQWPAHLLAPYAGDALPVTLARAAIDWQGSVDAQVQPAGMAVSAAGQARVADLRLLGARGKPSAGDELLSWRELSLDGLEWRSAPGQAPRLVLTKVGLSDFYASLVVTEQGHLNLNDLQAPTEATEAGRAPPSAAASVAAASAAAPAASASAPALQLVLGGVELRNGRVDFADRYIRPNYSAAISELGGTIGAYRWDAEDLASVELAGRVAGTGQLDIRGKLKPTAQPLVLDIRARATDLELTPLSPYAAKYAGYAIERGKLSMDLRYQIQPDGRLEARNQIVLNQLTFGDKVDSPDATRLPVLLAVALLKDRNGVIDLDLPIGGSINDPEFSVGGLVLKLILNLLTKALTAPFALLSGGGGAEDLGQVAFEPGTARLAPPADEALAKVARSLAERPALQLTITGVADPLRERTALQAAALEQRLRSVARSDDSETQPWDAARREAALRRLYADTPLPNKPRNLLGLATTPEPAQMESLLLSAMPADEAAARALATRRAEAARDALRARGLPNERLFLAAPRLSGQDGPPAGASLQIDMR